MTNCYQNPPLKVISRTMYLNKTNPSEATVYMMQSLVVCCLKVTRMTTKSISKKVRMSVSFRNLKTLIYPSYNGIWSSQNIEVSIGSKASLAWKTEAVIPFEESKFIGKTVVHMAQDATILFGVKFYPLVVISVEKNLNTLM